MFDSPDALFKDVFSNMHVHGRERVVEDVDISVTIHCTSKTNTVLLTTREIDASLSNFYARK